MFTFIFNWGHIDPKYQIRMSLCIPSEQPNQVLFYVNIDRKHRKVTLPDDTVIVENNGNLIDPKER